MKITDIARLCHEVNRAIQIHQADPTIPPAAPWEQCGEEMQASAADGVRNALGGASPEESHDNWCQFKLDHGWRWGPVKDEDTKQHPLLVGYDSLPESQRLKDAVFVAIVRTLDESVDDE